MLLKYAGYIAKEIYKSLGRPLVRSYALRKYGGIWGLKGHLFAAENPSRFLLDAYDEYFAAQGSWIGYRSQFDGIPCFPHGHFGIFVSNGASIGKNAVIFQQVTIGSNSLKGSNGAGSPHIGANVYIGAGAKIIGNVIVGDNCRIGANAVVYRSMPPHSVAVCAPTRIIEKSALDNRYYSLVNGKWGYDFNGKWIEDAERDNYSPANIEA